MNCEFKKPNNATQTAREAIVNCYKPFAWSGGIVRGKGPVDEVIRYIDDDQEPYQCVAGWVSENV